MNIISLGAGVQSTELAWAAGFFDGEGNTRLEPSEDRLRSYLRISIGQIDKEPLERFRRAVGGVGRIYGPYKKDERWKPIWTYSAKGQDAHAALRAFLHFCSTPKRVQAEKAIAEEKIGDGLDHCKRKVQCPSGHAYDEANTYVDPFGFRHCRTCQKDRDRARRP